MFRFLRKVGSETYAQRVICEPRRQEEFEAVRQGEELDIVPESDDEEDME